jgi:uncharacterized protein (TIGR03067 family)
MRRLTTAVMVVLAGLAVAAPKPKDSPSKGPDIAGDWILVSLSMGGVPTSLDAIVTQTEFTADGRRVSRNRLGQVVGESPYNLGRDQDRPTIDLRHKADGPVVYRGIYAVETDTLTICYVTDPAADRPTKLEAPAGSKVWLAVYTRAKKN